jgi:hypothetical protein
MQPPAEHILSREFTVSEEDEQKVIRWLEDVVYPPLIEAQLANPEMADRCRKYGVYREGKLVGPYLGAIASGPTYCFTPNGVGESFVVICGGHTLDLTDIDSW